MCPVLDVILLLLSNKTYHVLIFENIHITKSYLIKCLVNIWYYGHKSQDFSCQNTSWNGILLKHFSHLSWFSWTKTTIFFLFQRLLYKKYDYEKKNMCLLITLAATGLTRHPPPPPPSTKRKILPNLKMVLRVLGYSNTGVH